VKRCEDLFARCRAAWRNLGCADATRLECGNVVGLDFRSPALLAAASFGSNLRRSGSTFLLPRGS